MKEIVLKIEGMHCNVCVMAIKGELEELETVKDVEVDLNKKQALIKYDSNIDIKKVELVIKKLGFKLIL